MAPNPEKNPEVNKQPPIDDIDNWAYQVASDAYVDVALPKLDSNVANFVEKLVTTSGLDLASQKLLLKDAFNALASGNIEDLKKVHGQGFSKEEKAFASSLQKLGFAAESNEITIANKNGIELIIAPPGSKEGIRLTCIYGNPPSYGISIGSVQIDNSGKLKFEIASSRSQPSKKDVSVQGCMQKIAEAFHKKATEAQSTAVAADVKSVTATDAKPAAATAKPMAADVKPAAATVDAKPVVAEVKPVVADAKPVTDTKPAIPHISFRTSEDKDNVGIITFTKKNGHELQVEVDKKSRFNDPKTGEMTFKSSDGKRFVIVHESGAITEAQIVKHTDGKIGYGHIVHMIDAKGNDFNLGYDKNNGKPNQVTINGETWHGSNEQGWAYYGKWNSKTKAYEGTGGIWNGKIDYPRRSGDTYRLTSAAGITTEYRPDGVAHQHLADRGNLPKIAQPTPQNLRQEIDPRTHNPTGRWFVQSQEMDGPGRRPGTITVDYFQLVNNGRDGGVPVPIGVKTVKYVDGSIVTYGATREGKFLPVEMVSKDGQKMQQIHYDGNNQPDRITYAGPNGAVRQDIRDTSNPNTWISKVRNGEQKLNQKVEVDGENIRCRIPVADGTTQVASTNRLQKEMRAYYTLEGRSSNPVLHYMSGSNRMYAEPQQMEKQAIPQSAPVDAPQQAPSKPSAAPEKSKVIEVKNDKPEPTQNRPAQVETVKPAEVKPVTAPPKAEAASSTASSDTSKLEKAAAPASKPIQWAKADDLKPKIQLLQEGKLTDDWRKVYSPIAPPGAAGAEGNEYINEVSSKGSLLHWAQLIDTDPYTVVPKVEQEIPGDKNVKTVSFQGNLTRFGLSSGGDKVNSYQGYTTTDNSGSLLKTYVKYDKPTTFAIQPKPPECYQSGSKAGKPMEIISKGNNETKTSTYKLDYDSKGELNKVVMPNGITMVKRDTKSNESIEVYDQKDGLKKENVVRTRSEWLIVNTKDLEKNQSAPARSDSNYHSASFGFDKNGNPLLTIQPERRGTREPDRSRRISHSEEPVVLSGVKESNIQRTNNGFIAEYTCVDNNNQEAKYIVECDASGKLIKYPRKSEEKESVEVASHSTKHSTD